MIRRRAAFLALAAGTIVVGLVVHLRGGALHPVARDVLGDALWAMMIAWFAGMLVPRAPLVLRSGVAYAVCVAVELSQLYHSPALDAARGSMMGRLTLGTGFDPRDLAAYAAGVALAALLESITVALLSADSRPRRTGFRSR